MTPGWVSISPSRNLYQIGKLSELVVTVQRIVASMTWMPACAGMTSLRERAIPSHSRAGGNPETIGFLGMPGLIEQLQITFDHDFDIDTDPDTTRGSRTKKCTKGEAP
jgi:hypothetical protein